MKYTPIFIFIFFLFSAFVLKGQQVEIKGTVKNEFGKPIENAYVILPDYLKGTSTNKEGYYSIIISLLNKNLTITISRVGYKSVTKTVIISASQEFILNIEMEEEIKMLQQLEVRAERYNPWREKVSLTKIKPEDIKYLPSPFGEFNKALASLPGVSSNNELSSSYSVRGGSFDENQVYVNDIPVYRPFLLSSGQQEGLSFVNSNLVDNIEFSSGGWEAKYGDKLSSNLNITYKVPRYFSGSVTASLLGGALDVGGLTDNKRFTYILGFRHKSSKYLLNTMDTDGEFFPKFSDFQTFLTYDFSKEKNRKDEIEFLFSYARNRYLVEPASRETTFGTLTQPFKLNIYFDGRELMNYDVGQGGLKYTHKFSSAFKGIIIASLMRTKEREFKELEGGYRLYNLSQIRDPEKDEESGLVGITSEYESIRNVLNASIGQIENKYVYKVNSKYDLEFGVGGTIEDINDKINEYSFNDSADYISLTSVLYDKNTLHSNRIFGYVQNTHRLDSTGSLTYGLRMNYWNYNDQLLVSPRVQYSFKPHWKKDILFKSAIGMYQQPPFYRELRDQEGNLHKNIKAQSSIHFITGIDYNFKWNNRNFKFTSELYYKYLYNVIPYDLDDVRLKYFAKNNAEAYAIGADFRINGEFIKDAESWFSLGFLSTEENIKDDGRGWIRRPTHQWVNFAIFFQDHIKNNPSVRMYFMLVYGSGFPFGPPNDPQNRNSFFGKSYKRADMGFSKVIELKRSRTIHSLWMGLEVLNLFHSYNVISYTWIKDNENNNFGVPNTLSARFLNAKIVVNF